MDHSILETIKNTKDKVRFIMQEYPETRNNDNLLCAMYWKLVDGVEQLEEIAFSTPAEAVRRSRQLLNQKGILLATDPEILEKRRQKGKEMRAGITKI